MNHRFEEWIAELLLFNNIKSISELSSSMIAEEIKTARESIGNERLWALGATGNVTNMHRQNLEDLTDYMKYLTELDLTKQEHFHGSSPKMKM